jgi:hypothetical protein
MFQIGQKVVCVNDGPPSRCGEVINGYTVINEMDGLKNGAVYTIRGFGICWDTQRPGLFLNEIVRPLDYDGTETPFDRRRFRPAVQRKTDISIFKEMLAPKRIRELVD